MAFRDFARAAFLLPGTMVNELVGLIFGSTTKDKFNLDVTKPSLLGLVLDLLGIVLNSVKDTGLAITDFITDHRKAISIAFWSSLALGGAAALAVAFLPAALTAVTTFTINGYSIAGLVGAEFAAQVGAVAAVAAFAASAAVYTVAAVANTINFIIGQFPAKPSAAPALVESANKDVYSHGRMSASGLSAPHRAPSLDTSATPPTNFGSVARAPKPAAAVEAAAAAAAPALGK